MPAEQLYRFWLMVAHYHAQPWNASEIAASLGVSYKTAQHYLDILTGAFMIRALPAWARTSASACARPRRSTCATAGSSTPSCGSARCRTCGPTPSSAPVGGDGAEHVLRVLRAEPGEAFSWATHGGAEFDLLLVRGERVVGPGGPGSATNRARG